MANIGQALSSLTDAGLFSIGRFAHLMISGFDDFLPAWVALDPITEPPYSLEQDAARSLLASLCESGLLEGKEELSGEPDAPPPGLWTYRAAPALSESTEVLLAEIRLRHPEHPPELPAIMLLADAARNPAGFDRELINRTLDEPPASLNGKDAGTLYHRLVKESWIHAVIMGDDGIKLFPSPKSWAHLDTMDRFLAESAPEMRRLLVEGIISSLEITPESPLAAALAEVDRAYFMPKGMESQAYRNRPVAISTREDGSTATTSSPNVCAVIVQSLEIARGNRVLVCGVKGGFTAALCAHIVGPKGRVTCLETDPAVLRHARESVDRAGLGRRIDIRLVKDVTIGLEDQEPWDAVVVNGKIPKVPRPLVRQMADGGRLLIFLQDGEGGAQTAYLIRKNDKAIENKALSSFVFTPIFGEFGFDPPNWQDDLNLLESATHEVFISYSSKDASDCDSILKELEGTGIRCWQSSRDHPVDKGGYEAAIMEALKRARLFLIILSHESVASDHVKNELTNAVTLRKAILPVRLVECPARLPASFQYHLERYQQFDLERHTHADIVTAAGQLLGASANPAARPSSRPGAESAARPEPAAQNNRDKHERFDRLLEICLQDGAITRVEMEMLLAEAVDCFNCPDKESARNLVITMARQARPDLTFEA